MTGSGRLWRARYRFKGRCGPCRDHGRVRDGSSTGSTSAARHAGANTYLLARGASPDAQAPDYAVAAISSRARRVRGRTWRPRSSSGYLFAREACLCGTRPGAPRWAVSPRARRVLPSNGGGALATRHGRTRPRPHYPHLAHLRDVPSRPCPSCVRPAAVSSRCSPHGARRGRRAVLLEWTGGGR